MIRRIVSIPPPHPAGGEDRIIWARSGSGSFSVRSAYWTLKENSWSPKDDIWKLIWRYQGPQRAKKVWKLIVPLENWAQHFESSLLGIKNGARHIQIHQHCPEDWVFLSTDRAVTRIFGNASAGRVVPREYNRVADHLAKISLSWQTSLQISEVPPDAVTTSIQQDKAFSLS
ncbi:hypothetical protein J1N35_041410 [Gossypium stocksii]|uniref:RNase H type-1 domain-containing protein n=1 Tax=Gossypium stocksii TaxID=47602 RepID=A0A9D3UFS7_9ROSI|nr:hypothetical protein J1N35_041410 [Gossypium stocksii]